MPAQHPAFTKLKRESTPATDTFSLGSIFYTIMTGHWQYKSADPPEQEDRWDDETRVEALLSQGVYPDVRGVTGSTIMMDCWTKRYKRAEDILQIQMVKIRDRRERRESMTWSAVEGRVSD